MLRMASAKTLFVAITVATFSTISAPGLAPARDVIVVTSTIQAAVDAAQPGDTIFVPPGTYRESVLVNKNDITITGSRAAVIDAAGLRTGIRVGTGRISRGDSPTCPPLTVENFTLDGLTIKNAGFSGIFLIGVNGYRLAGSRYIDNPVYGPFPVCSQNGLIEFNSVEGGDGTGTGPSIDAGIYVGDDDTVMVTHNHVTNHVIGIEIENSSGVIVQNNTLSGNTSGILVVVLPGLPKPFTEDVRIQRNTVVKNNLPNPVPADSGDPVGLIPSGTGILNVGGDRVIIRDNRVIGNDSLGVAIVQNPFAGADPRIEPNPDDNEVRENVIVQNGQSRSRSRDNTGRRHCFRWHRHRQLLCRQ